MNTHLTNLMDKEVSRKEFLAVLGLAAASIFGMGTLIKLFTGKSLESHNAFSGYGASAYGGKPKR